MTKYIHKFLEENGKIIYEVQKVTKKMPFYINDIYYTTNKETLSSEKYNKLRTDFVKTLISSKEKIIICLKDHIKYEKEQIKNNKKYLKMLRKEL